MQSNIDVLNYHTWYEFKAEFVQDLFKAEQFREDIYIFRGHASSEWQLLSSFDRWYEKYSFGLSRIDTAKRLLEIFMEECSDTDVNSFIRKDERLLYVLAQHHGVPTRLLDWTESPYVAAFFSFYSFLNVESDQGESVAIWALRKDSDVWNHTEGVEIMRTPRYGNIRLRNQRGSFTISKTHHSTLEEYVSEFMPNEPPLTKILLPTTEAHAALADLAAMGITPSKLFPGLDGAAMTARFKLLLNNT